MECVLKSKFDKHRRAENLNKTTKAARRAAADGIVLLRNRNSVLPLSPNTKISVFGRCQINYNSGGTGSGGSVNTRYVTSILEALRRRKVIINEDLASTYENWIRENPINTGGGQWASRPLYQVEMPIPYSMARHAAEFSGTAIVVVGRTSGEEQDNSDTEGSFRLTTVEREMLKHVSEAFAHTIVLINTSNIIDMKWADEYNIDSILYIWQGGQEGGDGVADVLMGVVNPSGRLTDTIAYNYSDYPSSANFGDFELSCYAEDIYVGYRYFETFAKDKVIYPFGYGLSYTEFAIDIEKLEKSTVNIEFAVSVKNVGSLPGMDVVQIYLIPNGGEIDKPSVKLVDFAKTKMLKHGETEKLFFSFPISQLAVYDEDGIYGEAAAWVIEKGVYTITASHNIRDLENCFTYGCDKTRIIKRCNRIAAPNVKFDRIYNNGGSISYRQVTPKKPLGHPESMPGELRITGDKGYKFNDVKNGRITLDEFAAQLSVDDMVALTYGEGMNSPKVRLGTGAAFGGITEGLEYYGVPIAAATDGPSGLRFDNGDKATLIPIATMLASTWDRALVRELYSCIGREMSDNDIDLLLGPGMNIHRDPLCGRNFEYFSEDPLVSGVMAAAVINGLQDVGVDGTLKHIAANNQEHNRKTVNSAVTETALREIYLKGLEYALEMSEPHAVMTAYNRLNGSYCGSNYELINKIIRSEFGFKGMIMTDWWADLDGDKKGASQYERNTPAMLRAGTDIYMVIKNADDIDLRIIKNALISGELTVGDIQTAAKNVLRFILRLPVSDRL